MPEDSGTGDLGLTCYQVQAVLVKLEAVDNENPISCTFRVISRIFLGICSLPCEENKAIGFYHSNICSKAIFSNFSMKTSFFFHIEFAVLERLATMKSCLKN